MSLLTTLRGMSRYGTARRRPDRGRFNPHLAVEPLEDRCLPSAMLVRDIDTITLPSDPALLTEVGATLFFTATDGITGVELWKSDGTETGTTLVKDIRPGSADSRPRWLTNVGGTLFFAAEDGSNGLELWKSDGTAAGTMLVKNINPGDWAFGSSGQPLDPILTNVGGTLFFRANDGSSGIELWKSDGTEAGTVLVKDIRPGLCGFPSVTCSSNPAALTNLGGTLFFAATNAANGTELWRSDGTETGTALVKDIYPGSSGSSPGGLTNVAGTLFFTASSPGSSGLWRSDGTEAGTVSVSSVGLRSKLTNVSGTLFFTAHDTTTGTELWKSDGTASGTVLVKDIYPGTVTSCGYYGCYTFPNSSSPRSLTNVGGTLFFVAETFTEGAELWKSDGTAAGTVLVKDINPGAPYCYPYYGCSSAPGSNPEMLTEMSGTLFFTAWNALTGGGLWRSDGTEAGTALVKDLSPEGLVNAGGTLFFAATQPALGRELWRSDGTGAGTTLVKDVNTVTRNTNLQDLVEVNGTVYFVADDTVNGLELWRSDRTAGAVLVKDIYPGSRTSYPRHLTNVNGTLFFVATTPAAGLELWRSDGTEAGTLLVKDIRPGPLGAWDYFPSGRPLVNYGGTLFFGVNLAIPERGLWMTDGTAAGTVLVKDVSAGQMVNVSGTLFFTSSTGLWRSDGTTAGTTQVSPFSGSSLTAVGGTLFFLHDTSTYGVELWKSDGTAAGTTLVKDIRPGSASSWPRLLTEVGGTLFFVADDGSSGHELWKSDGTPPGTVLVKDIRPGSGGSFGNGGFYFTGTGKLTNVNGTLFFAARGDTTGVELWKSDGTAAGTSLVKDISPSPFGSSYPDSLTSLNGRVYFTAEAPTSGRELWVSDGTPSGTQLVQEIVPGSGSAFTSPISSMYWNPFLTAANGQLFFVADDGRHGRELWKWVPGIPHLVVGADAGGQPRVRAYDPTGAERFDFLAFDATFTGGVRVAAGDLTGDGLPELFVASGPGMPAELRIYDGSSPGPEPDLLGSVVLGGLFPGGFFVAAGDLTGDGLADLVLAPDAGQVPFYLAFDLAGGALLGLGLAYEPDFTGGVRVALADVNGDGRADLITAPGPGRAPTVRVFDVVSGSLLRSYDAFEPGYTGGLFVAGGDVTGDGRAEIVVGSGGGLGSLVRVFDGTADGPQATPLAEYPAYPGSDGAVRLALADVDGDGDLDLLTAPGAGAGPQVRALLPQTGEEVGTLLALVPGFAGGLVLAG